MVMGTVCGLQSAEMMNNAMMQGQMMGKMKQLMMLDAEQCPTCSNSELPPMMDMGDMDNMDDNMDENMGDNMGDSMGDNMGDNMGDIMGDNMGDNMGDMGMDMNHMHPMIQLAPGGWSSSSSVRR